MITVPAHKVRQFGVDFYQTSFTSGDIQKLVKFEVLSYSGGEEEEKKKRKSEKVKDEKEYFVNLFLDPEITHSKEGMIEGWLSKELYPIEGTIRGVVLFGDVKGTLVKKVRST